MIGFTLFVLIHVVIVLLHLVVAVSIAPHFHSAYSETRVGAVLFFTMAAVRNLGFLVHTPGGGIVVEGPLSAHMLWINGWLAAGLFFFINGLYADQKVDVTAYPDWMRFGDRLMIGFAENRAIKTAMDWFDRHLGIGVSMLVLVTAILVLVDAI